MASKAIRNVLLVTGTVIVLYQVFKSKPDPDTFGGKRREIAKTNIASGYPTAVTIPQLYNWLPSDEKMEEVYEVTHESPRSAPEKKNVTIVCWLYTYVCEDDADYHLIIGSSPDEDKARFFSAEISGLPEEDSPNYKYYNRLKKARDQFKAVIAGSPSRPTNYISSLYNNPKKIRVTGSLYWDTEHLGGRCCSGPEGYKSEGAWEIHPVTAIEAVQ